MQYCFLQHWTLLLSPVPSTTGCCFCFGSIPSFFLELFLHWSPVAYWAPIYLGSSSFSVLSFCLFILFMGFSRQEYWSGLPFPSPVNHILSDFSTMTHVPTCFHLFYQFIHSFVIAGNHHAINSYGKPGFVAWSSCGEQGRLRPEESHACRVGFQWISPESLPSLVRAMQEPRWAERHRGSPGIHGLIYWLGHCMHLNLGTLPHKEAYHDSFTFFGLGMSQQENWIPHSWTRGYTLCLCSCRAYCLERKPSLKQSWTYMLTSQSGYYSLGARAEKYSETWKHIIRKVILPGVEWAGKVALGSDHWIVCQRMWRN